MYSLLSLRLLQHCRLCLSSLSLCFYYSYALQYPIEIGTLHEIFVVTYSLDGDLFPSMVTICCFLLMVQSYNVFVNRTRVLCDFVCAHNLFLMRVKMLKKTCNSLQMSGNICNFAIIIRAYIAHIQYINEYNYE